MLLIAGLILAINTFTPLWWTWGLAFLGIEGTAIWSEYKRTGKITGGTLSALVRRSSDRHKHPVWRKVIMLGWWVLTFHFFFGLL